MAFEQEDRDLLNEILNRLNAISAANSLVSTIVEEQSIYGTLSSDTVIEALVEPDELT